MEFITYAFNQYKNTIIDIYFGNFKKDIGGSYYIDKQKYDMIENIINQKFNCNMKETNKKIYRLNNMIMYDNIRSVCRFKQCAYYQTSKYIAVCIKYTKINEKYFPIIDTYDDVCNLHTREYNINNCSINFVEELVENKTYYYITLKIKSDIDNIDNINNIINIITNYL